MLISKKELKNIITETKEFINESYGSGPCPISTANQLHSAGASDPDLQDFINSLIDQFMKNKAASQSRKDPGYTTTPNRGGLMRGVGF
jgi:hypothetical protein